MNPRGYTIRYSNSDEYPAWIVSQMGYPMKAFYEPDGLRKACEYVNEAMRAREDDSDVRGRS